jgi:trehalose 6-phosphate synthase/phosphatase
VRSAFAAIDELRVAASLLLLLDYDGTLVPFAPAPALAVPDPALLALLGRLVARPRTTVHLVSGRLRETLETWFGDLPVGLHAEHGLWSRRHPRDAWHERAVPSADWRASVRALFAEATARTPGALVEEKTASLAWHYRMADPAIGPARAAALARQLVMLLDGLPAEVLPGDAVIEVRPRGIHKGLIVAPLVADMPAGTTVVAIGDDRTDEDLFAALPPDAVAIHVGPGPSRARWRLDDVAAARAFLAALVDGPPPDATAGGG